METVLLNVGCSHFRWRRGWEEKGTKYCIQRLVQQFPWKWHSTSKLFMNIVKLNAILHIKSSLILYTLFRSILFVSCQTYSKVSIFLSSTYCLRSYYAIHFWAMNRIYWVYFEEIVLIVYNDNFEVTFVMNIKFYGISYPIMLVKTNSGKILGIRAWKITGYIVLVYLVSLRKWMEHGFYYLSLHILD